MQGTTLEFAINLNCRSATMCIVHRSILSRDLRSHRANSGNRSI
jgi:hypothetical protein